MSGIKDTCVFVGGSQDGTRYPVPKETDARRLKRIDQQNMKALRERFAEEGRLTRPSSIEVFDEVYTRRALYASDGEVFTYFALEGVSDNDALRHLFENYRGSKESRR